MSEPAFPSHGSMGEVTHEGMSLKDYFAAMAMQAMIQNKGYFFSDREKISINAYDMADAMLKIREEKS